MTEIVTDKNGRKIQLRRVGVLETLRLFKALGNELSNNQAYLTMAVVVSSAQMIDDVPLPFPTSEAGLEALLERLGDDGVDAINDARMPKSVENVVAEAGN